MSDNTAVKSELKGFLIAKLIGSNYIVFNFYYIEGLYVLLEKVIYFNCVSAGAQVAGTVGNVMCNNRLQTAHELVLWGAPHADSDHKRPRGEGRQ